MNESSFFSHHQNSLKKEKERTPLENNSHYRSNEYEQHSVVPAPRLKGATSAGANITEIREVN